MPREKVAVILVPGIFASHVTDPVEKDRRLAWPVNDLSGMATLAVRTALAKRENFSRGLFFQSLPEDRKPPSDIRGQRGWQTVFLSKYEAFLRRCATASEQVLPFEAVPFAAGYNFVNSNETSAARTLRNVMNEVFKELTLDTRFFLVTHSMGALVARRMMQIHWELHDNCLGVIHTAAPNAGAPETLMRFIRGVDPGVLPSVGSVLFGGNGWKVCTAASKLAAGFQLLPYPRENESVVVNGATRPVVHVNNPPQRLDSDPFFLTQIARTKLAEAGENIPSREIEPIISDIANNLVEARRFYNALGSPNGVFRRTASVVYTGVETTQAADLTFDSAGKLTGFQEFKDTLGDGTVPQSSQQFRIRNRTTTLDGRQIGTMRAVTGVTHENALVSDAGINSVIDLMKQFWRPRP